MEQKILAYIRTSTDKQDLRNQEYEILAYAHREGLHIDDFIKIEMSSRKSSEKRRITEMLERLTSADTLIVTELSRLGRSTSEVIELINELVTRHIRVIVLKQGLDINEHNMQSKIMITLLALFAELERDLISQRTIEALKAKKQQGIVLGKPMGTIQKSKFDADLARIKELLALGLSVRKIANLLGYTNHRGLNTYIKKRELRKQKGS